MSSTALLIGFFVLSSVLASSIHGQENGDDPVAGLGSTEPSEFHGAGSSLLPLAPTRVRRWMEDLRIRHEPGEWWIESIDLFENGPSPETVSIGLPDFEGVAADGSRQGTLSQVRLVIDGVEVAAALEPPPVAADLGAPAGIGRIYVWQLRFEPNERKLVRLEYRLRSSRTQAGDELLFYYLNTGTPWYEKSGRINVRLGLESDSLSNLVMDWIRPQNFGRGISSIVWRFDEEEPSSDIVIAYRSFKNPLDEYRDRNLAVLTLSREETASLVESMTPRERGFWQAFLKARRGANIEDEFYRNLLAQEEWYQANPSGQPFRDWTAEESYLFDRLAESERNWESLELPHPQELRQRSR